MERFQKNVRDNSIHLMCLGGYIFLLVGLIFFLVGTGVLISARKKAATYEETTGVITDFDRDGYPYITYTVHGKTYEQRSSFTTSSYRVGQELPVRYDPDAPYRMEVAGKMALFLPIMFMGMGGLFLVIGVLWVRFFRRLEEPENPWAGPQT